MTILDADMLTDEVRRISPLLGMDKHVVILWAHVYPNACLCVRVCVLVKKEEDCCVARPAPPRSTPSV